MPIHFKHLQKDSYIEKESLNVHLRKIIRYEAYAKNHEINRKNTSENHYKRLNNTDKISVLFIKKGSETVDIKQQVNQTCGRLFVWRYYHKNKDKNFSKNATYLGKAPRVGFTSIECFKDFFEYRFPGDIKDYVLQKEDTYISDFVVGEDPFPINGLQTSSPGIKQKS